METLQARNNSKKKMVLKKIPRYFIIYNEVSTPKPGDLITGYNFFDIYRKQVFCDECQERNKISSVTEIFRGLWVCTIENSKDIYILLKKASLTRVSINREDTKPKKLFVVIEPRNIPKLGQTLKDFYRMQFRPKEETYFTEREHVKESNILISAKNIATGVFVAETATEKMLILM